jgi:hypothetical protein
MVEDVYRKVTVTVWFGFDLDSIQLGPLDRDLALPRSQQTSSPRYPTHAHSGVHRLMVILGWFWPIRLTQDTRPVLAVPLLYDDHATMQ